jgi:hypothetical protein
LAVKPNAEIGVILIIVRDEEEEVIPTGKGILREGDLLALAGVPEAIDSAREMFMSGRGEHRVRHTTRMRVIHPIRWLRKKRKGPEAMLQGLQQTWLPECNSIRTRPGRVEPGKTHIMYCSRDLRPGLREVVRDLRPIDGVPPCLDVIGASVLIFQVVGVLPDI